MRHLAALLLCALIPVSLHAQVPAAKPQPKASVKKQPARKAAAPAPEPEEPAEIDTERMAVAPMVMRGDSECEFKQKIHLSEHPTLPGRFLLEYRGLKHILTPQPTTTGVIRLEDKRTGIVWLQVPIKSMLMDTKKGQRLIDNCMHAEQRAEVEANSRQESALTQ